MCTSYRRPPPDMAGLPSCVGSRLRASGGLLCCFRLACCLPAQLHAADRGSPLPTAQSLQEWGEHARAVELFSDVLSQPSATVEAWTGLASSLLDSGKAQQAVELLEVHAARQRTTASRESLAYTQSEAGLKSLALQTLWRAGKSAPLSSWGR